MKPASNIPNTAARCCDNLAAGLRLARGYRESPARFHAGSKDLIIAVLSAPAIGLLWAKLAAGADATLWNWGVSALIANTALTTGTVLLLSCMFGWWQRVNLLLVVLFWGCLPPWLLVNVGQSLFTSLELSLSAAFESTLTLAISGWLVFIVMRTLQLINATPGHQLLFLGALLAVLVSIGKWLPSPPLFYHADDYSPREALDVESIYYQQPALLQQTIRNIPELSPAATNLYFIAMAPYAAEDVFKREITSTTSIIDSNFAQYSHTLALINHRDFVAQTPLANLPNLQRLLAAIAARSDPANDIVTLFISSHGSEDASLAAEFSELAPNDLTAADIRAALDAYGFAWRVVIVSACYSGSFIQQLRGPGTLVITAAAADRTSFGCDHNNQWTYFGEAYFRDSFNQQPDFITAFEQAREMVTQRETTEGRKPSEPQIDIGEGIAEKLAAFYTQLKHAH